MPIDRRIAEAERFREPLLDRAGEARQLGERQRAAAHAAQPSPRPRRRRGRQGAPPARERRRPARAACAATGISRGALAVEQQRERSLERGERELVGAKGSLERVAAEPLDEGGAPDDDPRLRPAEQLVPREAHEVGAGRDARPRADGSSSNVEERARAEVVHEREAHGAGNAAQLGQARLLGEADDAEVRLVHPQEERRLRADRAPRSPPARVRFVVPTSRRRGARAREHVGNPEAVADLDQLAARDEYLAALGERREREQDRRRVVVHDQRGLRARQPPQQAAHMILPRSARRRAARSYSRFE